MTKAEIVAQISRQSGIDGCGKRGVLARVR